MFDGLISFIRSTWTAFWEVLKEGVTTFWGIVFTLITALVVGGLEWGTELVNGTLGYLVDVVLPEAGLTIPVLAVDAARLANTIAPMSEMCVYFVIWSGFALALQFYRFAKSWIPTLAG